MEESGGNVLGGGSPRYYHGLEHVALFRREKVDGFPVIFPATVTTLKSKSL